MPHRIRKVSIKLNISFDYLNFIEIFLKYIILIKQVIITKTLKLKE